MGQQIEVDATTIGRVAVFSLDRSLTGQDAHVYVDIPQGDTIPEQLARRLWTEDEAITSVNVLSNTVTIGREGGWSDNSLDDAGRLISRLLVHYDEEDTIEGLRAAYYNATITSIRAHNPELWILRVTPDTPMRDFSPGQYTTLGLGYWEPRADEVVEDFASLPDKWDKLARRSYSVASSMVDDNGVLVPPDPSDIEFYIVQVRPGEIEVPALTPRLFTRKVGDRIFMGRKFAGRYTLDGVEPTDTVIFLGTGTGEAPHNNMTAELLRRGHEGRIISAVCVRYLQDLGYTEQHEVVESRYPNYRQISLTTREPENLENKLYIQDLITTGRLEKELGGPLDPTNTHVYLCGNPSMIGLPTWSESGAMTFPETLGVCQLLAERGFTIDRTGARGNVHYEEYWRDRSK